MKLPKLKDLIEKQILLKEQEEEEIWATSGCLVPDDPYFCEECTRDCIGEEHQGYVAVTGLNNWNWNFPFDNDIHDYGHTCCCVEDHHLLGQSWMWQPEPDTNPDLYETIHHWRNPCCYTNGMQGVTSGQSASNPSSTFWCTPIVGCLDDNAWNFDPGASFDCIGQPQVGMITQTIFGTETDFFDFLGPNNQLGDTCCCEYSSGVNPEGNISDFDSSCQEYENYINPPEEEILGCTDPDASNYNPDANTDDGSCEWDPFSTETSPLRKPIKCYKCEKNNSITLPENITILSTVQTLDGNWIITGEVWAPIPVGGETPEKATCPKEWTTDPNPCPGVSPARDYLECYRCDTDGETVLSQMFPQIDEKGCPSPWDPDPNPCPGFDPEAGDPEILGCTDLNASNYDGNADVDDGSCEYDEYGCMSETAENYDPNATIDDGSCIWDDGGCATCTNCEDGCCYYTSISNGCLIAQQGISITGSVFNPLLQHDYWDSCANENYAHIENPDASGGFSQNFDEYCDGDPSDWNSNGIYTDNTMITGDWAAVWCSQEVCCQAYYNGVMNGSWPYDNMEDNISEYNGTNCVEITGPITQGAQGMPIQGKNKKPLEKLRERFQKLAGIKKSKK